MIYDPFPFKICPGCKKYFPADPHYFHRNKQRRDKLAYFCRGCKSLEAKKERLEYPDRVHARDAKSARAHIKQTKMRHQRYYVKNAERIKKKTRQWQIDNPDKMTVIQKRHKEKHPESQREADARYTRRHPDKMNQKTHKRVARKKTLPATYTNEDWYATLDYWDSRCAYCSRPRGFWHTLARDHFIPLIKGGGYTVDNILPACHGIDGCNNIKNDSDPVEWVTKHFGPRKAKDILARIEAYFAHIASRQP